MRNACPNLITQLSKTMSSPKDHDEIDQGTKNDHAIDSFRYGVMWREYPVKCPETNKFSDVTGKNFRPLWLDENRRKDYL